MDKYHTLRDATKNLNRKSAALAHAADMAEKYPDSDAAQAYYVRCLNEIGGAADEVSAALEGIRK